MAILIATTLVLAVSCQKEETILLNPEQNEHTQLRTSTKYGNEVEPHILDYIGDKTNNTYKVAIGKDKLAFTKNSISSRDTPLGIVQTAKVIEVYNEKNTKYTFKVTDPSNTNGIINLVVVDMGYDITEYFIQYIFDNPNNLPYTDSGGIDMARFSGAMFFYDSTGDQMGSYLMNDGDLVSFTGRTDPCPEKESEENPTDDDGSNPSGGSPGSIEGDDGNGNNGYVDYGDDGEIYTGNGSGANGEYTDPTNEGCNVGVVWCCSNGLEREHDGSQQECGTGNMGGNGSWWIRTCDGGTFNPNAGSGRMTSDCGGEAGVITDIDTSTTALADCLGVEVNNLSPRNIIAMNAFLEEEGGCNPEITAIFLEFIEITEELPEAKFERYTLLLDFIEGDPLALVQDCMQQNGMDIANYIELYDQTIPQECSDRLFELGVEYHHQPITDGNVPCANIDYYSVEITNYPDFDGNGLPDTEAEMFQAFREKFMDLGSGEEEDFQFSCDSNLDFVVDSNDIGDISWQFVPLNNQDGLDFVSNNPIASILLIEADATGLIPTIAADDGAIIVSDFTDNDFTIATISTANNGSQPFSGNRQWGWLINQNGNFEFFTRAVDVANISKILNIGANTECQQDTYYNVAEATWKNMQEEIADWINHEDSNGGQAVITPSTAVRVDKETVAEILTSNESIDQIISNCN